MAQAGFDRAAGVAGTYLASPFARWRDFGEYRRALDGEAAVRLAQNSCAELDHDRPGDWPAWERLTPHIAAMVTSLASHLDLEDLGSLLGLSHGAFFSMGAWAAGHPDGEALARATMTAARRLGTSSSIVSCLRIWPARWASKHRCGRSHRADPSPRVRPGTAKLWRITVGPLQQP
nr:hypothetical protein GCM10020093_032140 [Planobispora longispora]